MTYQPTHEDRLLAAMVILTDLDRDGLVCAWSENAQAYIDVEFSVCGDKFVLVIRDGD